VDITLNNYIRYQLPESKMFEILKSRNSKYVTFFIDLLSIAKGLFNKKIVEIEISKFVENKKHIDTLYKELKKYIDELNSKFEKYEPYFVVFYEEGISSIHKSINKNYKSERRYNFEDSIYENIYSKLKKFYFELIYKNLNKYDNVSVIYLKNIEADFTPYYVINKNLMDTKSDENTNFILSCDKDLLQCLEFDNTFQVVSRINKGKLEMKIFNKKSALEYLYPKYSYQKYKLDATYIPLVLSIAGDRSDNIKGIKGYGYAKTIKYISQNNLPPKLYELKKIKDNYQLIKNNFKLIENNYKLISFEEIINLIPTDILENKIDNMF